MISVACLLRLVLQETFAMFLVKLSPNCWYKQAQWGRRIGIMSRILCVCMCSRRVGQWNFTYTIQIVMQVGKEPVLKYGQKERKAIRSWCVVVRSYQMSNSRQGMKSLH